MNAHDQAATETARIAGHTRYRHRHVKFVPASGPAESIKAENSSKGDPGKSVSSFYASIVGLSSSEGKEGSKSQDPTSGSISSQLSLPHVDSTIMPLPVEESNSGHRYLVKYGWQPLQRHGLGVPGREGRRLPIMPEMRLENVGVGAKTTKPNPQKSEDANIKKKNYKKRRKQEIEDERRRDEQERKRLMQEMYR
ncbi:hypothetical protein V1514DRAFT_347808 [Lipomyces japonicus]|uniref:uncharacterized protein n=1 Tax=Lipomyces japonicus TaxID=56871 RepID=UPI0034CD25A4